jgi:predicted nucleic acid-binding protein
MNNYRIYLDVCCLNRTLDNLDQTRIRLEAEAVTEIIKNCEKGQWVLFDSDIIKFEVSRHSDSFKQEQVRAILTVATVYLSMSEAIDLRTKELIKLNFKYYDALHLAFAEAGNADIFLTTDDRLLRKARQYQNLLTVEVDNPTIWLIKVMQGEDDED